MERKEFVFFLADTRFANQLIVVLIINKHFFCLFNRKKGLFDLTLEEEKERHGALVSQSKLVVFTIINIILVDIIIRLDSDCLVLSSGSSPSSGR